MLAALIAVVIGALLLGLAALLVWPLGFATATPQPRLLSGFHGIEQFADMRARWTRGEAEIALPRPPAGVPLALDFTLHNGRVGDQADPQVQLAADGRHFADFTLLRRIDGTRRYHVLLPPTTAADWAQRISISSDTLRPPGDRRDLGLVLVAVEARPLSNPRLPAAWPLFWATVFGLAAYALPRAAGIKPGAALAFALLLASLLAGGAWLRPLEILPFVQRLAGLLLLGLAGLWLARRLSGAGCDPIGRWTVPGAHLPIFLGIAWWLGLVYQFLMRADGASGVFPGRELAWIGSGLASGLLLLAGWTLTTGRALAAEKCQSRLARWATALLVLAALLALAEQLRFAFTRSAPDFWILFRGTREWVRGGSLYDLEAVVTNHFGHVFKVPPFYAMFFAPLVFEDGRLVLLGHRIMNLLLLAGTVLSWLRMWKLPTISYAAAGVLILANFRPLVDTLAFGQIDLVLLFLLTLAFWALREQRDSLAGILIAAGVMFKIYPILLLAFIVVKRRWWALAGFVAGMLLLNGSAIAVIGWPMHRVYLFEVVPQIGGTTSWVENQTVSAFLARLVATPTEAFILDDRRIALAGLAISALGGLLACGLSLPASDRRSTGFALQYGQFLLLMVLAVPAAWMHYQTLLFLVFAALLLHFYKRRVSLLRAALLGLAFGLIGFGNQWTYYDGTVTGILTILGISYKFYGMLLLGGLLVAELLNELVPLQRSKAALARLRMPLSQS
jgi:hypothetical protein